jgi:hypothetical protein
MAYAGSGRDGPEIRQRAEFFFCDYRANRFITLNFTDGVSLVLHDCRIPAMA